MPPRIWFIKNMTHEGAGLFSVFAQRMKISFEIVDLHKGKKFPNVSSGDAVVVLGGPDSANDRTKKIIMELEMLDACLRNDIPVLGICLGLQLLVKAGGGTILKSPLKEIGFRDPEGGFFYVEKTSIGKQTPLLRGLSERIKIFQLHGETVDFGSSMVCLARGRFCENQIVQVGKRAYGIQGHIELSKDMFEEWLVKDSDLASMDPAKLWHDFNEIRVELENSSEMVFKNFLNIAGILR